MLHVMLFAADHFELISLCYNVNYCEPSYGFKPKNLITNFTISENQIPYLAVWPISYLQC